MNLDMPSFSNMKNFTVLIVAFALACPLFADDSQPPAEGLVMWFKAEEGIKCAQDGSVSSWENSASGPDRAEGALTTEGPQGAPKPFVEEINGLPAVHLTGEGTALLLKLAKPIPQPLTMLMVLQLTGKPEDLLYVFGSSGGGPEEVGLSCGKFEVGATPEFYIAAGKAQFPRLDTTPFMEKASVLGLVADGGSSQFFGIDTESPKGDPGPEGLVDSLVIGAAQNLLWGGNYLVAEILIYNRNLDFPEREAAVKYLKAKYSLAP